MFDWTVFFRHDEDCYLYGVFDGHDGSRAANFAAQRMPAELLLGQLLEKTTDEDIKDVLNQVRRHYVSFYHLLWNHYWYLHVI